MRRFTFSAVLVVSVGSGILLIATCIGMHSACGTYYKTPNISDFYHFAFSTYTGHEGKIEYLFAPSLTGFAAGLVLLLTRREWLETVSRFRLNLLRSYPLRAALAGIGALLFLFVTHDHIARAVAATERMHWSGEIPSNDFVDTVCIPF